MRTFFSPRSIRRSCARTFATRLASAAQHRAAGVGGPFELLAAYLCPLSAHSSPFFFPFLSPAFGGLTGFEHWGAVARQAASI